MLEKNQGRWVYSEGDKIGQPQTATSVSAFRPMRAWRQRKRRPLAAALTSFTFFSGLRRWYRSTPGCHRGRRPTRSRRDEWAKRWPWGQTCHRRGSGPSTGARAVAGDFVPSTHTPVRRTSISNKRVMRLYSAISPTNRCFIRPLRAAWRLRAGQQVRVCRPPIVQPSLSSSGDRSETGYNPNEAAAVRHREFGEKSSGGLRRPSLSPRPPRQHQRQT